jgi:NAD(P)H-hydrate epimerase
MKILSAVQIRQADKFTIENEPISPIALMERAGSACFDWIINNTDTTKKFIIVCGSGNNGGDGLVIARLLSEKKLNPEILLLDTGSIPSVDFIENLKRVESANLNIREYKEGERIKFSPGAIIIDAIFGTGLNRPLEGWLADCVEEINKSGNEIIAIDLPSGLLSDEHSEGSIIHANHTLTIQFPKLSFFFSESEKYIGEIHILEIGIHKKFIHDVITPFQVLEKSYVSSLIKKRKSFSHKGNYGHSLLISGSYGKMGAAVLCARACLRSGTGLLTVHIPRSGNTIMQTSVPEAMTQSDLNENFVTEVNVTEKYTAVGIGPGIGNEPETKQVLFELFIKLQSPMVLDADALNTLSENPSYLSRVPENSIITPHPKEFERLVGQSSNSFDRLEKQIRFSFEHKLIVILKGANTSISTPDGKVYFNSTGNPGMAKGGSGDALTGIVLAFLAQKYNPVEAAILSVHIHGLAGDIAAKTKGEYAMMTTDLIESLPAAFNQLSD